MVAALLLALVLGWQPLIAKAADGSPLFFPFGWAVVVPALVLPHLLLGLGEAAVTVLVWRFARRRGWVAMTADAIPAAARGLRGNRTRPWLRRIMPARGAERAGGVVRTMPQSRRSRDSRLRCPPCCSACAQLASGASFS